MCRRRWARVSVVCQEVADEGDAGVDGPLAGVAEAEDQLWRVGGVAGAVGAHAVQPDGAFGGEIGDQPGRCHRGQVAGGLGPGGRRGDPGGRAAPGDEVALGPQLGVALLNQAADTDQAIA
jgi:hypothetical protein